MTKKHFIALADAIRSAKPTYVGIDTECRQAVLEYTIRAAQWQRGVNALADFCMGQNARFMRGRWLAYVADECGPNGGKV